MHRHPISRTFVIETVLFIVAALNVVLTLLWPDWIEIVFRVDPDNHSGSFEWALAGVAVAIAVLFGILARREWKKLSSQPA